jgi:STE24 endopeptidase
MNLFAIIVLAAMLIDFTLNLTADLLNLKRLDPSLPAAFKGWYSPDAYQRSQEYLKVNTRFGWLVSTVDLVIVLVFWFGGGFALLDQWVRGLQWHPMLSGCVFMGVLLVFKSLVGLPFGIYATFGIEARFGFNQTTWQTYIKDKVKALILSVLLGGPLLLVILGFFEYAGPNAWWYCWIITTVFILVVQFIAPTWIMPLFNRFDPLPEGELRDAITAYARSIDFALENIFIMDGSKRSTKSNAFFTGFGKHRRIVLFDTLIEKHSVDELVAVLAHEMGHFKKGHIRKLMLMGIVQAGIMFFVLSFFISDPRLFAAFYVPDVSVYAGLIFFGMLYTPLAGILGLIMQAISRAHEYAADRFAVDTAPQSGELATALKKLSVHNLSNLLPHPFYVFLNYSHPPVLERIAAIEKQASLRK